MYFERMRTCKYPFCYDQEINILKTHVGIIYILIYYSISNKLLIKIQYHNIYEEDIDQKHWLKTSSYQSILHLQFIILIWLILE